MSNTLRNKQNYNYIDLAKFIAALFVITIHCPPLTSLNEHINQVFVNTFSRLAVPFFFACSGYFFFSKLKYTNNKIENCKENRQKLFSYIRRVSVLYIIWSVIYLLWQIPQWYHTGWLSISAFIDYGIAFFKQGSYYHMWYILELIYATILGYILLSLFNRKIISIMIAILYVLGMLTYSYSWMPIPFIDFLNRISEVTSALWESATRALPLMMFGFISATAKRKITVKTSSVLFIISFIGLIIEHYMINNYTTNHEFFSYIIFTIPCEIFLFLSIISIKTNGIEKKYRILRNSSTIIYCLHPMIINLFGLIPIYSNMNSLIKYFIIAGSSIILAFLIVKLSNKIKFITYLY